jgi:hypothetical protein
MAEDEPPDIMGVKVIHMPFIDDLSEIDAEYIGSLDGNTLS